MSERDDIAKAFHNIYLVTAKAFKWPIRPEVDVFFEELSRDAQELDYALADFHLSEIARLRAEVEHQTELAKHNAAVAQHEGERADEALGQVAVLLHDYKMQGTHGGLIRPDIEQKARALFDRLQQLEKLAQDPDYSYGGFPIPRKAIEIRNKEIDELLDWLQRLEAVATSGRRYRNASKPRAWPRDRMKELQAATHEFDVALAAWEEGKK